MNLAPPFHAKFLVLLFAMNNRNVCWNVETENICASGSVSGKMFGSVEINVFSVDYIFVQYQWLYLAYFSLMDCTNSFSPNSVIVWPSNWRILFKFIEWSGYQFFVVLIVFVSLGPVNEALIRFVKQLNHILGVLNRSVIVLINSSNIFKGGNIVHAQRPIITNSQKQMKSRRTFVLRFSFIMFYFNWFSCLGILILCKSILFTRMIDKWNMLYLQHHFYQSKSLNIP